MSSERKKNPYEKIFYLASHGMMGDHWFDWVPKALNSHPELLIFHGETVRAKYLKERSRKDRPDLLEYTQYLYDVGGTVYKAVGECFCYRAYQLEALKNKYALDIRWANLVRHPYPWLEFYTQWRVSNMNMPYDNTGGIDHEWSITWHDVFKKLPLRKYKKEDIHIWSTYQGMTILNRMISDTHKSVYNIPLENIVSSHKVFSDLLNFLTRGQVKFNDKHLEMIYSWVDTPWRKNIGTITDPQTVYNLWPDWKKEAFSVIIKKETVEMFKNYGYIL